MTRLRQVPQLGIRAERRGPCHILFLTGELDLTAGPALERHARMWDPGTCPDLIVDLSGIGFCDSSGAAALIRLLKRTLRGDGQLILTGLPRQAWRRLRMMGVLDLFEIREDTHEAISHLCKTA